MPRPRGRHACACAGGAVADWMHLAYYFWHHGVTGEVAMPNMAYFLAGRDGLEMPLGLNVIDLDDIPHVE